MAAIGLKRKSIPSFFTYTILVLLSIINLYPVLWMVLNSFKKEKDFGAHPFSFPSGLEWVNYAKAWKTAHLGSYFINSFVISAISVVITLFVGSLAAYFISRFEFKLKGPMYLFFLFGMLIPIHATLVPIFIEMKQLNLLNTRWTLLFPYVAFNLPMTIYILVSYMNSFHKEVEESAVMDGAGISKIYAYITLPMLRPALATTLILIFLNNWNEFSFALVLINSTELKTLPLGLANFAGQYSTNYVTQMAGLTMVLVPTIVFYMLFQKELTNGMSAGAVKG
ncbi:carbohydrate ABC transporter permease [Paenibacillus frigoriresistens]|uniref:carbohydrate ABC transporter permease n=1 Tax=Paenibacillus alginolyticus TaxID=59839 RepID=UPI0015664CBE|nr:carbohydrate ABC transporter permease [Paenibacillus frigoriresistens]NRF93585.1 carbohydrate ABC transporter permease [Paenibacillus frigoriresistens]